MGAFAPLHAEEATTDTIWTCSMHPQIHQKEPGKCPICGMDLIPLVDDSSETGPRELSMSEASKALAEIQTTEVVKSFPEETIRLVGKLSYDETRIKALTARFPFRIDALYVNYVGSKVNANDALAEIYSPELGTAQRELLNAYKADPNSSITEAAKEKLRLWDLLPSQIDEILKNGNVNDHFQIKAPISGTVVARQVEEGAYVKTGQPLLKIVDLSHLWLLLNAYESDISKLQLGQDVSFSVEAYPGETFHGKVTFIAPELDEKTRTVPVRVDVPNADERLKPGMFAKGNLHAVIGKHSHADYWTCTMHPQVKETAPRDCPICGMHLVEVNSTGNAPLVVPESVVLLTGKRAVVYVEKPNAEKPTFEGREVVLGVHADGVYVVKSGLSEGENVVTNGAFKIDSAMQIQAKPSMMNPEPKKDHSEMNMAMDMPKSEGGITAENLNELLGIYFKMQAALAGDHLVTAKADAKNLMQITGHQGDVATILHHMLDAKTLDAFRKPLFDQLSAQFIEAVKAHTDAVSGDVFLMYCPMVYGDHGADWLQNDGKLQNPFFGSMMLTCGDVKGNLMEK